MLANRSVVKCAGIFNACDGFDISELLNQARLRIPEVAQPDVVFIRPKNISTDQSKPSVLSAQKSVYPEESRVANEHGKVFVMVFVDVAGTPRNVEVRASSGSYRLDAAAVDAVYKWRFLPAKNNGQPLASELIVPIEFSSE